MTLDLDQALSGILPWDFAITVDGSTEPTRPAVVADFARFASLKDGDVADAAASLFAGPAERINPWVATWRPEILSAAINAYMLYAKEVMGKNSQAIASAVATAMAPRISGKPSGNSTES